MTRRGKIVLAVLVVGSVLGLIAATNAWFIAVSNTPPGAISSALVRWLPEAGERSFPSILTYGNLISGSGVDPDGVPLVLPGDRLLASATVRKEGEQLIQTIRTSIARDFDDGPNHNAPETVDTVIHWEVREYPREDGTTVELTRKQRDVMDAPEPVAQWFNLASPGTPIEDPKLTTSDYDITTVTSGGEAVPGTTPGGLPTTTTTTVVTTTYTARKANAPSYQHVVTTTKIVTHEIATITPDADKDLWQSTPPTKYIKATETVLFVRDKETSELAALPTRSYVVIEHIGVGGAPTGENETISIPLALGNLSTTESCIRVGLNVRLTTADSSSKTLTLKGPDAQGTYYFGTTAKDAGDVEHFIELLAFRPYAKGSEYAWTPAAEETPGGTSPWGLWDLTVGGSTAVPVAGDTPTTYTVTELLGIVSKSVVYPEAQSAIEDKVFEQLFNELYCDKIPTITVHLSYYTRQSEFMDWTEFYSQSIDISMPE